MFTRAMFGTADMIAQHRLLTDVAQLVDQGVIKTTVGENYGSITPENLERAHKAMATEHTQGKIVLAGF